MEFVDQSILSNSVRFVFEDEFPTDPRVWIVKLLKKLINPENIVAVFQCGDRSWYVNLKEQDCVSKITTTDFSAITPKFRVERCDRRTVTMKINWLPVWILKSVVDTYLEKFGEVKSSVRETETIDGVTVSTGVIRAVLEIQEGEFSKIPYTDTIADRKVLINVVGRPPQCLRCKEVGHNRRDCPNRQKENTEPSQPKASQQSEQSTNWAESPMEETAFDVEKCIKEDEKVEPVVKRKKPTIEHADKVNQPPYKLKKGSKFVLDVDRNKRPVIYIINSKEESVTPIPYEKFQHWISSEKDIDKQCKLLNKYFPGIQPASEIE